MSGETLLIVATNWSNNSVSVISAYRSVMRPGSGAGRSRVATVRRYATGWSRRTISIAPAPCACQSAQRSAKNCSDSLLREPLGLPGPPLWPVINWPREFLPLRFLVCEAISISRRIREKLHYPRRTVIPKNFEPAVRNLKKRFAAGLARFDFSSVCSFDPVLGGEARARHTSPYEGEGALACSAEPAVASTQWIDEILSDGPGSAGRPSRCFV